MQKGIQQRASMASKTNTTTKGKSYAKGNMNSSSQHAMLELKQRVILVLNKLADRDTYQMAAEELSRIAESLSPEKFSSFLSCIYETDSQHKTTVRRECVRIFGTMASAHGELLAPHLAKIVGSIVRRLKDPDSNVRDACVDAAGILAAKVVHPAGSHGMENGGTFSLFAKPLCEALGEQNRYVQAGAALCLARVIENVLNPPVVALQKLLPRILKLLSSQSFSANAALLVVIGIIVQVKGVSTPQTLALLVPSMIDNLHSNDWATRKASAEAFSRMALSNASLLSSFKSSCVSALEACRFDKVKPVRDIVVQTLQVWKSIPDAVVPSPIPFKHSPMQGESSKETSKSDNKSSITTASKTKFLRKSEGSVTRSVPDSVTFRKVNKRAPLADKKTNLHVPKKMEKRKTENWHIEVALPRGSPPACASVIKDEEFGVGYIPERPNGLESKTGSSSATGLENTSMWSRLSDQSRGSCEPKCIFMVDNPAERVGPIERTPNRPSSKSFSEFSPSIKTSPDSSNSKKASPSSVKKESTESSTYSVDGCKMSNPDDFAFIRKHLFQIEDQQTSLMELLQVFMGSSLDRIGTLETKVQALERVLSEIAQELSVITTGTGPKERSNGLCRTFGPEMLRSRICRKNNTDEIVENRKRSTPDDLPVLSKSMHETPRKAELETLENGRNVGYRHASSICKVKPLVDAWEMSSRGCSNFADGAEGTFIDVEVNQSLPKALDKLAHFEKLAETRAEYSHERASACRNSFSNIRGIRSVASCYESSPFWSIWRRAVAYLCAKDIDSAYIEVLCSGDDLLLVQLMKRTGPVPESLSQATAIEVLHIVTALLLEQKFLDTVIPWLQKVVNLVTSTGPDNSGMSPDQKMELLSALQGASTMHFSQPSTRRSVAQIAYKLANAWAGDIALKSC